MSLHQHLNFGVKCDLMTAREPCLSYYFVWWFRTLQDGNVVLIHRNNLPNRRKITHFASYCWRSSWTADRGNGRWEHESNRETIDCPPNYWPNTAKPKTAHFVVLNIEIDLLRWKRENEKLILNHFDWKMWKEANVGCTTISNWKWRIDFDGTAIWMHSIPGLESTHCNQKNRLRSPFRWVSTTSALAFRADRHPIRTLRFPLDVNCGSTHVAHAAIGHRPAKNELALEFHRNAIRPKS